MPAEASDMSNNILVHINGKPKEVPSQLTISSLLQQLGLSFPHIAVAVNLEVVPRSQHAGHKIQNNDKIEIIQAVGGG